jgi:hypothetical protein
LFFVGKVSEINQSSVSQIDTTQQDVASQIRYYQTLNLAISLTWITLAMIIVYIAFEMKYFSFHK